METQRPDGSDLSHLTPDERLLNSAGMIFEMYHIPKGEVPESWANSAIASEWRHNPKFNMNPANANYAFSIVTRECRAALEDSEFALPTKLASTPKRTPLRYTAEEKASLERLFRVSIYPQIATQGFERFRETANAGLAEPNEPLIREMQNLALMRHHLGELCTEMKESCDIAYTPKELSDPDRYRKLQGLTQDTNYGISSRAKEILEVADYVKRQTIKLAVDINALAGETMLEKANIVDLSTYRGR